MPNRRHQSHPAVKVSPGTGKSDGPPRIVEKPAWPQANLPGQTQPRDRSLGVKKIRTRPKEMGV